MCEFNTKIRIAQLMRLTIVKITSPESQFFADFGAHFVENSSTPPTDLFIFVNRALPQKSSRITFQPRYANLLRSKIKQHDIKITKGWKYSSENFIETNNIVTIRGRNPSYFDCVRANKRHNPCDNAYAIK